MRQLLYQTFSPALIFPSPMLQITHTHTMFVSMKKCVSRIILSAKLVWQRLPHPGLLPIISEQQNSTASEFSMKHHKHLTTYIHSQKDLRPINKIMCEWVLVQHTSIKAEQNTELTTKPTTQMGFLWDAKHPNTAPLLTHCRPGRVCRTASPSAPHLLPKTTQPLPCFLWFDRNRQLKRKPIYVSFCFTSSLQRILSLPIKNLRSILQ